MGYVYPTDGVEHLAVTKDPRAAGQIYRGQRFRRSPDNAGVYACLSIAGSFGLHPNRLRPSFRRPPLFQTHFRPDSVTFVIVLRAARYLARLLFGSVASENDLDSDDGV